MFAGFRNVTFNNIKCSSLQLPYFNGREDGAVENVSFNNCVFEKYRDEDFPHNKKQHGAALGSVTKIPSVPVTNVINLEYNNTRFVIR